MAKRYKTGYFHMDLSDIQNYLKILKESPEKAKEAVTVVGKSYAFRTKQDYISNITSAMGAKSYAQGFKDRGGHPFHEVEWKSDGHNFFITVGFSSFIAKFLEAGTKKHYIEPYNRGRKTRRYYEVKGIKGSKALANAYRDKYESLAKDIADEINKILSGK